MRKSLSFTCLITVNFPTLYDAYETLGVFFPSEFLRLLSIREREEKEKMEPQSKYPKLKYLSRYISSNNPTFYSGSTFLLELANKLIKYEVHSRNTVEAILKSLSTPRTDSAPNLPTVQQVYGLMKAFRAVCLT